MSSEPNRCADAQVEDVVRGGEAVEHRVPVFLGCVSELQRPVLAENVPHTDG